MLDIIVPVIILITAICISLGQLRRDILWAFVYRAAESQRSHGVDSPWTAMVFLSCRIVFPADTCTVTVLTPSRENVQATLPSRVITGCWGRKTGETEEVGGRGTESGGSAEKPLSHHRYLHFRVRDAPNTHARTHLLERAPREATIRALLHTVSGADRELPA